MTALAEYAQKYKTVRMERRNGILQLTLHTEGKALPWGVLPHEELPAAFYDVDRDRDNGDAVHGVYPLLLERQMQDLLGYGLALEGMALMEKPVPPQAS